MNPCSSTLLLTETASFWRSRSRVLLNPSSTVLKWYNSVGPTVNTWIPRVPTNGKLFYSVWSGPERVQAPRHETRLLSRERGFYLICLALWVPWEMPWLPHSTANWKILLLALVIRLGQPIRTISSLQAPVEVIEAVGQARADETTPKADLSWPPPLLFHRLVSPSLSSPRRVVLRIYSSVPSSVIVGYPLLPPVSPFAPQSICWMANALGIVSPSVHCFRRRNRAPLGLDGSEKKTALICLAAADGGVEGRVLDSTSSRSCRPRYAFVLARSCFNACGWLRFGLSFYLMGFIFRRYAKNCFIFGERA